MSKDALDLEKKIQDKKARVGVVGMGYVGLPLVKTFLNKGFEVLGFDIDKKKVNMLNQGKSYIKHVSAEELKKYIDKNKFRATTDFTSLAEADVIIICVPTPLDSYKNPDLSYVLKTTETIFKNLKKGHLVVLESTTYPGTTEDEMLPLLEAGGLKVGKDFFLAYSPERENPGDTVHTTEKIPKVVGGVTPECSRVAKALYDQIIQKTVSVSSPKVAEATKIMENVFRSVNIAMVNEMKMIFRFNQTVRVHALLPRSWVWRSLHPCRSLLSCLESQGSRSSDEIYRACRGDQYLYALFCCHKND
jgi:UDP-N-acetyl-D-glucosamine dehydrogenase